MGIAIVFESRWTKQLGFASIPQYVAARGEARWLAVGTLEF
jgi:hypothetical protein